MTYQSHLNKRLWVTQTGSKRKVTFLQGIWITNNMSFLCSCFTELSDQIYQKSMHPSLPLSMHGWPPRFPLFSSSSSHVVRRQSETCLLRPTSATADTAAAATLLTSRAFPGQTPNGPLPCYTPFGFRTENGEGTKQRVNEITTTSAAP